MATKPLSGGSSFPKRDPIPSGLHVARCVALYELGTIEESWQGQAKAQFKISVGFELPNQLMDFTDDKNVVTRKPAMISQTFTLSAHEKSTLRKFMESWRGATYNDGEFENVDLSKMLGVGCMLNIIHNVKGEDTYANINQVMPVMPGIQVPPQFNASKYLAYDSWNQQLFDSLPKFLKEKIQLTPEFRKLTGVGQTVPGNRDPYPQPGQPQWGGTAPQQPYQAPVQAPVQQPQYQQTQSAPAPQQHWQGATGGTDIAKDDMPF
jgi:hypothetical protein